jgi:APA family basic amino acid/polyamine antiporter
MAKDNLLFKTLEKESEFQTPVYTLILSAVMSSLLIVLGFDVNALLTFVVFAGLIFNTLIFISVFLFRKRKPLTKYPRYQVIGYPVIPAVAILGMVMLLIATIIESTVPSIIGVVVLALGYAIIYYIERQNKKHL